MSRRSPGPKCWPRPECWECAKFYRVGGAQAIAALAYGTESIPRVDKIVGPGNLYVTAAKKLVSFDCAIDFLAGPTEVVIVSDAGTPEFIAADLVAQAEHDPEALAVFITTRDELARRVARAAEKLSRRGMQWRASRCAGNGIILVSASTRAESGVGESKLRRNISRSTRRTLRLCAMRVGFRRRLFTASRGDYASGPNHVLPTGGAARFRGGLSVLDFVKLISVQRLSRPGLKRIAPVIESLANTEGLRAHAESIRARFDHA